MLKNLLTHISLQENCDSDDSNDSVNREFPVKHGLNNEKMSALLENSNIMNMKDSIEIINAICNENVRVSLYKAVLIDFF